MEANLKPGAKTRKVFNRITILILITYVVLIIAGGISAFSANPFMSPDLYSILTGCVVIALLVNLVVCQQRECN